MRVYGQNGYIGSRLGELPDTDDVILLAGHSSVAMCKNDPHGAWVNNVDFFRAILNDLQPHQKLIYASSASVYDGVESPNEECDEFHLKGWYDLTKRTIDSIALLSGKQVYGLRFATVNGWSPNLRVDVMLNKMMWDATNYGFIRVQNPQLRRPILGIRDAVRAIKHILRTSPEPGIYNLASFEESVIDMADYVAEQFYAEVRVEGDQPAYAFGIDTTKIEATGFVFQETLESVVKSLHSPIVRSGVRI